jgi:hypothetical protein
MHTYTHARTHTRTHTHTVEQHQHGTNSFCQIAKGPCLIQIFLKHTIIFEKRNDLLTQNVDISLLALTISCPEFEYRSTVAQVTYGIIRGPLRN